MKSIIQEIWKDIKGYEGLYQVSNLGRVKSLDKKIDDYRGKEVRLIKGKIMNTTDNGHNYLIISLTKNKHRKNFYVHRLVAQHFIENPNGYSEVNHKDYNKQNNVTDNLEWCDRKYNTNYSRENMKKQHNCKLPKITNEKYIKYKEGAFEVTVYKKYYGRFKTLDEAVSVKNNILECEVA